jgi:hypothetical protein
MRILEIQGPCDFDLADGEATADPAAKRCGACRHTVHDLSSMTAREGIAFLDARRPGQCVSFERGEDERIVFADGPGEVVGRLAKDARPMVLVASLLLAACDRGDRVDPQPEEPPRGEATTIAPAPSAASTTPAGMPETTTPPSPSPTSTGQSSTTETEKDPKRGNCDTRAAAARVEHKGPARPNVPKVRLVGI